MAEKAAPLSAWTGTRVLSLAASLLLGVLLAVLFVRTAQIAAGIPPNFDGAMNLQVAASIAKGEGYRRNYAAEEAFPHEIQTGPPYILPAAVVFKLWGIGIPQAEVVNLAYLVLLLAMAYLLVAPLGGRVLGLFAACTVMAVPGLHAYGFYGYGEIPALAWVFAATVVYFRRSGGGWTGFAAGVLLALAVYTKTVMLIGVGALGLCAFLEMIAGWRARDVDSLRRRFAGFVAGGFLMMLVMETWRMLALGGGHAWHVWWSREHRNISMQAGVTTGFGNYSHTLLEKLQMHFALLSHDYRMSLALTGMWLALIFVACVFVLFRASRRRRTSWQMFTILLIAVVYLTWWLLVTPTSKAWHRRVIDGMIAADVGLIMVVAAWVADVHPVRWKRAGGLAAALVGLLALALPATWLMKVGHTLLVANPSPKTCGWYMASAEDCARFNPGASVAALQRVVREVRALPANAYVFGFGWYSAPRIGLFARRHILDFHDVPVATVQPSRPVYFVQGSDTPPESLERVRTLYGVAATPDYAYALIHAASLTPPPMLAGAAPVRRHLEAAEHYAYLRGFNHSEGANGRWLTDDNQVLLMPRPGDVFELVAYVLPIDRYEVHRAPRVLVSFDGCMVPAQSARPDQVDQLFFAIPSHCGIPPGKPVSVRIEVDNLVDSAITLDQRALGVLARSFGFVAPARPQLESLH